MRQKNPVCYIPTDRQFPSGIRLKDMFVYKMRTRDKSCSGMFQASVLIRGYRCSRWVRTRARILFYDIMLISYLSCILGTSIYAFFFLYSRMGKLVYQMTRGNMHYVTSVPANFPYPYPESIIFTSHSSSTSPFFNPVCQN